MPLLGVHTAALPRWTQWTDFGFSARVTVTGTWTGEAIDVQAIEAFEPALVDGTLGCDADSPPQGEPPTDERTYEQTLTGLSGVVYGSPSIFAGYGPLAPDPPRVIVVGTVEAPARIRDRVAQVFPFAFCVRRVPFSHADLEATAARIAVEHPAWVTTTEFEHNAVAVVVPFVDAAIEDQLSAYPGAIARPLMERLRS